MIYLDSCSVVKLVVPEPESPELITWLGERSMETIVSSALVEVEVPRALRRVAPGRLGAVNGLLTKLDRFDIDAPIRATAGAYIEPHLRSLDAIHLATAEHLVAAGKNITAFVTYDKRLGAAAKEAGLTVVAPGSSG